MKTEHKTLLATTQTGKGFKKYMMFLGTHNSLDYCFKSGVRCIVKKLIRDKSESVVYRLVLWPWCKLGRQVLIRVTQLQRY